jgi:hypothetical protein
MDQQLARYKKASLAEVLFNVMSIILPCLALKSLKILYLVSLSGRTGYLSGRPENSAPIILDIATLVLV